MFKDDLITIIIPAYNHENFIEESIDSIIKQTYLNIELIILNDGSNDNTALKIKNKEIECRDRFAKFIFIDKENEGVLKTIYEGLKIANGKYISYHGSDDLYQPDAIKILHNYLRNYDDYFAAVGDNFFINKEGKKCFITLTKNNKKDIAYSYKEFWLKLVSLDLLSNEFGTYKSLLKRNYIPNGYLFRKEIFNIIGYDAFKKNINEDYYIHLQLSKYGKYKFINKDLYRKRVHSQNTNTISKVFLLKV